MKAPSARVRNWLRPLTLPASRIYAAAIASRNRKFDRGEGVQRVDRPVISVGNITTGGTGKTPMVAWIARTLLEAGHRPIIAMRGYGSKPGERSDEELEYRSILREVEVLANPNRVAALRKYLPQHREIDCVILDDGFQHRRVHRDLDLVLIDAQSDTFGDALLPAGTLREPPDSLARASAVIVTHADGVDDGLAQEIDRRHGQPPLAWTRHAWSSLIVARGSLMSDTGEHVQTTATNHEQRTTNPAWLRGKRVLTLLGIGNPNTVIAQIENAGAKVMANIPAGDHERFDRAKLLTARGLADGLDAMIVTRKDWVKIEPLLKSIGGEWRGGTPIIVPQLEIEFVTGEDALSQLILNAIKPGHRAQLDGPDRRVPPVR